MARHLDFDGGGCLTAVLDFGYLKIIEPWGRGEANLLEATPDYECGIIEAARQSTQGSFRGWDRDAKLLAYLYSHKHATPFEFAGCVIEVQAPIAVFREWHRHRTQSYNEMSARYEPLPDLYYVPTVERLMLNADGTNKQAGTAKDASALTEANAEAFRGRLETTYSEFAQDYAWALSIGIPKEAARFGMPVGHYSRMRASANLRNWLAFLTLRMDPAAQYEIRMFANELASQFETIFPQTMKLFNGD